MIEARPALAAATLETIADAAAGGGTRHVRFRETRHGRPVFDRAASVHTRGDELVLVHDSLAPEAVLTVEPDEPRLSREEAIDRAASASRVESLRGAERAELGYVVSVPGESRLAWRVDLPSRKPLADFRVDIDAIDGTILSPGVRDRLRRADGTGRVFDPNPVATSGDTSLRDGNDADTGTLTAQLVVQPLRLLDGSGFLRGPYCDTRNSRGRAFEPTLAFLYTRSDPRFEEVMIYRHVTETQLYLQSILGSTRVLDRAIVCEAHGTDEDQSFFSPVTGGIEFGDGGVDGAEDAETIFHEVAHAIQEEIVPGIGESDESLALMEGFADWMAASISASPERTPFGAACVSDWDAVEYSIGTPPCLRRLPSGRRYPDDLVGQRHEDGQIWSSALWALREAVGRDVANRLAIESHFYLAPDSGFLDAARALFLADTALHGRANHGAIAAALAAHGLLPSNPVLAGNVNAGLPRASFSNDGESGESAFTKHSPTGNGDFALVIDPAAPSPSHAFRTTGPAARKDERLQLPPRVLPATRSVLRFEHRYDLESRYDGAVLEIAVDGGAWLDAASRIAPEAGYDRELLAGSSGPLAGRRAWSGSRAAYSPVVVDLAGLEGRSVAFRWRIGCDESVASPGWFIDDVSIRGAGGAEREDVLLVNAGPPAFFDVLESGAPLFSATLALGSLPFALIESPIATSPSHVYFCPTEDGRKDATLTLGPITLPIQPTSLVFRNRFSLETGYDGARLFIRGAGEPVDLGKKIREGGYSGSLGDENPMGAGQAWTGSSGPSMKTVRVDLADWAGETVWIDFRVASDDTVGGGGFAIDDVLLGENTGAGGDARRLRVRASDPFRVEMRSPSGGPDPAPYAVFLWNGACPVDGAAPLPFDIGALALPVRLHGAAPAEEPALVLSNVGREALLGAPDVVPPFAPAIVLDAPGGFFLLPGTYTIQGLVFDRNATGGKQASVTNGLVIEVIQ